MNVDRQPLFDKKQTADKIREIVDKYYNDLDDLFLSRAAGTLRLSQLPLREYYDFVREIKYRRDPKPIEIVARPYYLVKYKRLGLDCKKKTVLIASFLKSNDIPFRLIGTSQRADRKIHHIFPQGMINGRWLNLDATYRDYRPFQTKKVTAWEVL